MGGTQALSRSFFSLLIPRGPRGRVLRPLQRLRARHLVVRHVAVRRGLPAQRVLPARDPGPDRVLRARARSSCSGSTRARHPRGRQPGPRRWSEPARVSRTSRPVEPGPGVSKWAQWVRSDGPLIRSTRRECSTPGCSLCRVDDGLAVTGSAREPTVRLDIQPEITRRWLMGERTLRGARLGGQSFEDERGIEFAARQKVGYACPQGHEFEITMSVEADVPAIWECPRCGAEALSTDGLTRRRRSRSRSARTGTCCSSVARSRSSRTSSPSAWSCCAAARSARRTCTGPARRRPVGLSRAPATALGSLLGPGAFVRVPAGSVHDLAGDHRRVGGAGLPAGATGPPGRAAKPGHRVRSGSGAPGSGSGRAGPADGSTAARRATPEDVGDEAGGEQQRAADQDQRAVGELLGGHPVLVERLAQRAQARPPSRFISQAPSAPSATSSSTVHQAPITWPTWIST